MTENKKWAHINLQIPYNFVLREVGDLRSSSRHSKVFFLILDLGLAPNWQSSGNVANILWYISGQFQENRKKERAHSPINVSVRLLLNVMW